MMNKRFLILMAATAVFITGPAFAMEEERGEAEPRSHISPTLLGMPPEIQERIASLVVYPNTFQSFNDWDAVGRTCQSLNAVVNSDSFFRASIADSYLEERTLFNREARPLFHVIKRAVRTESHGKKEEAADIYLDALIEGTLSKSRLVAYRLARLLNQEAIPFVDNETQRLVLKKIKAALHSLYLENDEKDPFYAYKDEAILHLYFRRSQSPQGNVEPEEKVALFEIQRRIQQAKDVVLCNNEQKKDIPVHLLRLIALYDTSISDEFIKTSLIRAAAERGDREAQFSLACRYERGEGVERDKIEAARWWKKAADQGCAPAQLKLGVCYDKGEGVEQNKRKAADLYKQAADQGYPPAQLNLGVCYDNGEGIEQNKATAIYWIQKAADQGYAEAQFNLGMCYEDGYGVEQNKIKALYLFRQAAQQGHENAQLALEQLAQWLKAKSLKLFRKSAREGHEGAQLAVKRREKQIEMEKQQEELLKSLISANHEISKESEKEEQQFVDAPLSHAVMTGDSEKVNLLLQSASPKMVNTPTSDGFVALHFAAMAHNNTLIIRLLELGADKTLKSQNGWTAKDYYEHQICSADFKDSITPEEYEFLHEQYPKMGIDESGVIVMPEFVVMFDRDVMRHLGVHRRIKQFDQKILELLS